MRALGQVFNLGLSQSRLARDGPIDRLLGAIDEALLNETTEALEDLGLVSGIHGAVFGLPVGQDTEPAKLPALLLDVSGGEFGAGLAYTEGVERLLLRLELLHHLMLNR